MDKYKIDGHKLHLHVPRVNDWLKGENIYPIFMEVSPAGACNHRCTFCGVDFMEYQNRSLDTALFKERLTELGKLGLKSLMYAGEGEPFLHRDMADILRHSRQAGLDPAVTTNGTLLKREIAEKVLDVTEWIKVSINAGTKETYAKIHRTKDADFDKVIENLSTAAEIKRKNSHRCVLGMQSVLLPENRDEMLTLAEIARDIGMDYLVVKPYSQHPQSKTEIYKGIKYAEFEYLDEQLAKLNTDKFHVVFRSNTMKKWDEKGKPYERCFSLPFWSYIDAGGGVWGCSVYLRDERFYYGSIYEQTFKEIWESERRQKSLKFVHEELDVTECRKNCRMDEVNRYLWDLKHPTEHVNFI